VGPVTPAYPTDRPAGLALLAAAALGGIVLTRRRFGGAGARRED
jgi:MYXO-CTERM domain-containing protein